jgi:hypothetical protein
MGKGLKQGGSILSCRKQGAPIDVSSRRRNEERRQSSVEKKSSTGTKAMIHYKSIKYNWSQ